MTEENEYIIVNDTSTIESNTQQQQNREYVQLIDEDGNFTELLPSYLKKTGLISRKLDYSILAVLGPQSSGKSTLLNGLFGTSFPTMNDIHGRYQVTKGVCASTCSNVLIMDLEGTDSKERGEENMGFERKISLFALSMAEVLIVNMWFQDIGRYNASNYSLLKTVFELNLQLFQTDSSSRTLLLFVIRDHIRTSSPLEVLQNQILADINRIWDSLIKPKGKEDSKVGDFFDIQFESLPHYILEREKFDQSVNELKKRFLDPKCEKFVFLKKYKKNVPIDGFQHYAENIWKIIMANKDLDLPTQKEMLAIFRCGQIAGEVFTDFIEDFQEWTFILSKKQRIKKFGEKAKNTLDKVMKKYDEETRFYTKSVSERKGKELEERMKMEIRGLFKEQLNLIRKESHISFVKLLSSLTSQENVLPDFTDQVQKIRDSVLEFFDTEVKAALLPGEEWESSSIKTTLNEEIDRYVLEIRRGQIQRLLEKEKKCIKEELNTKLSNLLSMPKSDLWKQLRELHLKTQISEKENLKIKLKGFNATDEEIESLMKIINEEIISCIKSRVKETKKDLSSKLYNKFIEEFKFSKGHVPRVWRRKDEIEKYFKIARQMALEILDLLFLFRLEKSELDDIHITFPSTDGENNELIYPKVNEEDIIVGEDVVRQLYENFVGKIAIEYKEAETQQILNSQAFKLPTWAWIAIIVLGWNEFWYILTHPFWLLVTVFCIGFFGWGYIQNLLEDYMMNGNPVVVQVIKMILEKIPIEILNIQDFRRDEISRETPRETPIRETPIRETPIRDTPIRDTPIRDTPIRDTPRETPRGEEEKKEESKKDK